MPWNLVVRLVGEHHVGEWLQQAGKFGLFKLRLARLLSKKLWAKTHADLLFSVESGSCRVTGFVLISQLKQIVLSLNESATFPIFEHKDCSNKSIVFPLPHLLT